MTNQEWDNAINWARAQGFSIYQHHTLAHAYLAGQAASVERIKALEGLVQNLMLEARARTMRGNTPLTTNIVEMTVPDRVALLKEADQ